MKQPKGGMNKDCESGSSNLPNPIFSISYYYLLLTPVIFNSPLILNFFISNMSKNCSREVGIENILFKLDSYILR